MEKIYDKSDGGFVNEFVVKMAGVRYGISLNRWIILPTKLFGYLYLGMGIFRKSNFTYKLSKIKRKNFSHSLRAIGLGWLPHLSQLLCRCGVVRGWPIFTRFWPGNPLYTRIVAVYAVFGKERNRVFLETAASPSFRLSQNIGRGTPLQVVTDLYSVCSRFGLWSRTVWLETECSLVIDWSWLSTSARVSANAWPSAGVGALFFFWKLYTAWHLARTAYEWYEYQLRLSMRNCETPKSQIVFKFV